MQHIHSPTTSSASLCMGCAALVAYSRVLGLLGSWPMSWMGQQVSTSGGSKWVPHGANG